MRIEKKSEKNYHKLQHFTESMRLTIENERKIIKINNKTMKIKQITSVIAAMAIIFGSAEANARVTINAKGKVTTRTEMVKNFDSLINKSVGNITYEEGESPRVKIVGPYNVVPYIEVKCTDGKLEIGHKDNANIRMNGKRLDIIVVGKKVKDFGIEGSGDIIIAQGLSGDKFLLGVSGSGDIEIKGALKASEVNIGIAGAGSVELKLVEATDVKCGISGAGDIEIEQMRGETLACGVTGAGDITAKADVKTVSAGVTGAGTVSLKGKADKAKFGVSGSGDVQAEKMEVSDVEAGVSGSGDIFCYATQRLAATSTATGKVVYSGNPTNIKAGPNVKHRARNK